MKLVSAKAMEAYDAVDRLHAKKYTVSEIAVWVRRHTGVSLSLELIRSYLHHRHGVTDFSPVRSQIASDAAKLHDKIVRFNRADYQERYRACNPISPEAARSLRGARIALPPGIAEHGIAGIFRRPERIAAIGTAARLHAQPQARAVEPARPREDLCQGEEAVGR